jgi:predicted RNase H-like HicB family nuclease
MNSAANYVKIIEWSEEDKCFVGSCPGLFYGGCHGDNEQAVFAELCDLVEETIALYEKEGRVLPPPTAGKDYANLLQSIG